ncbi:hypothetical protein A9Q81_23330 [Gammaproteobacteria bacterium 42_54_T18]|nr:hypothetical protein A9Q81_23330 [Gammaproteobacteria bacterium 42_54_T18]
MKNKIVIIICSLIIQCAVSLNASAEDIEIYVTDDDTSVQSNVLLLIDTSGSMDSTVEVDDTYGDSYTITDFHTPTEECITYERVCSGRRCTNECTETGKVLTRMEIVQDVASDLIETTNDINISLMRFDSGSEGGYVDLASQDIADVRTTFQTTLNNYDADGFTPLEESYYEVYRYFSGKAPEYGDASSPSTSDSDALSGGTYISPITDSCQKNNVILFTDGQPTRDTSSNSDIQNLVSGSLADVSDLDDDCSGDGECLDELAYYLSNTDLDDDLDGDQTISTYTIGGFGLDGDAVSLLENVAKYGDGAYHSADDAEGLGSALESIIQDILSEDSTFAAPSVSVSAFNSLQNSDELYYALFKPGDGARWHGNLKRYKINENNEIEDANGSNAIDSTTGFFSEDSKSFWSGYTDGSFIVEGGMAHELTLSRSIFTYTGSSPANTALNISSHSLHEDNNALTKVMLGIDSQTDDYREALLQWAQGIDVLDEDGDSSVVDARNAIGDPLHSQPLILNYFSDDDTEDTSIFFTTNEGFLHGVSTSDGSEQFAFIPQALLPNIESYKTDNSSASSSKVYGLDGPMSAWFNDANGDGDILQASGGAVDSGEHLYLYLTMRRGGRNFYALDVTDRSNPVYKWKIEGGSGDFEELGQTWSKPTLAKVKINDVEKTVLIFGGGYDVDQDDVTAITADDVGRAIYIVDAETGDRLWWSSVHDAATLTLSDMEYSIPSNITNVDIDNDGYDDFFYVADMGGQVWRFDIDNNNTAVSGLVSAGVVAVLSDSSDTGARRFYNQPDISLVNVRGTTPYLTIAIGSGFRAHPLNTDTTDRFYMIKDSNVFNAPSSYQYVSGSPTSTITETNLYDATEDLIDSTTEAVATAAKTAMNSAYGWYITLENEGEKVLAESITYDFKLLFTTFAPSGDTVTTCGPDTGVGRLYLVNLLDATPVLDSDGDTLGEPEDRVYTLLKGGIPPAPVLINNPNSESSTPPVCVSTECLSDIDLDAAPQQKTYWRENKI